MIPRLSADTAGAKRYLEQLSRRELPKVIGRSLMRSAASGKTFLSKTLRQRINLKKRDIDQSISTRRSNEIGSIEVLRAGRAWFEVRVSGNPIPLRGFAAKSTRRGATYKVSKIGKRRVYVRKGQPGFIVQSLGGHVFVRKGPEPPGPETVPIQKVFGPSLPQYFSTRRVQDAEIAHVRQFWAREVIRNARFALQRRGRN